MIDFHFYLITDRNQCVSESLTDHIEKACQAGIKGVQLREKDLSARELFSLAKELRAVTDRYDARLFVNDRVDIAMAVKADGVHCRETSLSPDEVKSLDDRLMVGASVHSLRSAKDAEKKGADFLLFGPIFKTPSKLKYGEPQGLVALQEVVHYMKLPVFAVGGIIPDKASDCMEYGAFGVAGISSVMQSENVDEIVGKYKKSIAAL